MVDKSIVANAGVNFVNMETFELFIAPLRAPAVRRASEAAKPKAPRQYPPCTKMMGWPVSRDIDHNLCGRYLATEFAPY